MTAPVMPPADCATMAEVRAGVDALDRALVDLLAERMRYMAAAARIKPARTAVRDEARKAQVIANVVAAAGAAGVPPGLAAQLWETLVEGSIAYEYGVFDELARANDDAAGEGGGASDGARTRDLRRDRPAL